MCRLLMRALLRCARWGLFLPLLCLLFLLPAATSLASETPEPVYTITETELVTLENNLAKLSAINSKLQQESKTQNQQSAELLKQVTALRQESEKQQALLTAANKSLEEYAIAAKKERLRIKAQRNAWEAVAACALIAFVAK